MTARRLLVAASGVLLAVAVGIPTAWWAGRPDAAAGVPVAVAAAATEAEAETEAETGAGTGAADAGRKRQTAVPARPAVAAVDRLPTLRARSAAPSARAPDAAVARPVRVRVPSLGVDANVVPVGVRRDGAMGLPSDGARVGWYRHGPEPGAARGSAVLAGHVDTRRFGPGALLPLERTAPGAEVLVDAADGTTTRWRVLGRERFEKAALPVADLFRREGPPRLVIVTCGGEYLPEVPGYRDNVVVVAERAA